MTPLDYADDGKLTIDVPRGVAWQSDLKVTASYDEGYFNKCASYEGSEIADALNKCRNAMVARHYGDGVMVDIGIGSGEFIRSRPNTLGDDVNHAALMWLSDNKLLALTDYSRYGAFSFWDVIEHIPDPETILRRIPIHAHAFFSIPVFDDLRWVPESKHYRPGEHIYYWTRGGFVAWMLSNGFYLLEMNNHETLAGRESIESFAFVRMF